MKDQKWIFNWKFGLLILAIMLGLGAPAGYGMSNLIGYLIGAILISVMTGFDKTYRL